MNKKHVVKYLVFVFVLTYIFEIIASIVAIKNPMGLGQLLFTIIMVGVMYVPFFGVLFARGTLKGVGFKPKFKGCAYLLPIAFFGPFIAAVLGGALFFAIFPDMFSLNGSYFIAQSPNGAEVIKQLEAQGLSVKILIVISIIQSITYAPILNMLAALGEEVGWRGFLYPELNKSFGKLPTWLIGGTIWGAFHYPIIILVGYEYGMDYFGFPIVGIIVFTIWTIFLGLLHEVIYDKSKCIWYPALLHGAVNACGWITMLVNYDDLERTGKLAILGPFFNGAIGGIPMALFAIVIGVIVMKKTSKKTEA